MNKHLESLDILCNKLRVRYGDNDDLVLQLKQELSVLKEKRTKDLAKRNFGRRAGDKCVAAPAFH